MNNKLIISEMKQINIYDLNDDEVRVLAANIIENINLKQLKEEVIKTCLKLTGVGSPSLGCDVKFIALDNQRRLELTHMLLSNFDLFESYVKNFKRNKSNCRENDDYIFNFLYKTKDLVDTIIDYGEFRLKEKEDNQKQLLAHHKKLLSEGVDSNG